MLHSPLEVPNENGFLKVLEHAGETQAEQGEALSLDTIVHSCDAELIAKGHSAKGPNRGAIVRHGPYTLWAYAGGVGEMTAAGKALFINTLHYAARQKDAAVLEKRLNKTRYGLEDYLEKPGLLGTLRRYLPEELATAPREVVIAWIAANRPYFYVDGRRYRSDAFAKSLKIPNHKRAFLERCIALLRDGSRTAEALTALKRYTGLELGVEAGPWQAWYTSNRDYLFFSDCDGFRFKVDERAKAAGIPFEKMRGWSSEELDYRSDR